ncbi:unnamed protein product, partial [Phaeothamnion confervicola]
MFPDYIKACPNPMDFGTIRQRLQEWRYKRNDPDSFARDMRLVFNNCKVYNQHGSAIWLIANAMAMQF